MRWPIDLRLGIAEDSLRTYSVKQKFLNLINKEKRKKIGTLAYERYLETLDQSSLQRRNQALRRLEQSHRTGSYEWIPTGSDREVHFINQRNKIYLEAVKFNDISRVKYFLDHGADPNIMGVFPSRRSRDGGDGNQRRVQQKKRHH